MRRRELWGFVLVACAVGHTVAQSCPGNTSPECAPAAWVTTAHTLSGVSGWSLVRFLPAGAATWHYATDDLAGAPAYTTAQSGNGGWSVVFPEFDELFISSADFSKWVHFPQSSIASDFGTQERFVYSASSVAYPDAFVMYNRGPVNTSDPVIACVKDSAGTALNDNVYVEASSAEFDPGKGSLVFVRTRPLCERRGEAETVTGMRDWLQIKHLPRRSSGQIGGVAGNTFSVVNGVDGTFSVGTRPSTLLSSNPEWALPFVPGPLSAGSMDYYFFMFRRSELNANDPDVWVVYTRAQLMIKTTVGSLIVPWRTDEPSRTSKVGIYHNRVSHHVGDPLMDSGQTIMYQENSESQWGGRNGYSLAVFHKRSPFAGTPTVCCAAGSYASDGACTACPQNGTSREGAQAASDCFVPVTCPSNAQETADGRACVCDAGTQANNSQCAACANGKYATGDGVACADAPEHGFVADASSYLCNAGYSDPLVAHACSACAADTYKEGAGNSPALCLACKDDSASAEASISAASCECEAGYSGGASALDSCSACEKGTYKAAASNAQCARCPEGSTTAGDQATGEAQCVAAAGHTQAGAAFPACAIGTYKAQEGAGACEPCAAHETTKRTGATSSAECECVAPAYVRVDEVCGCAPGFLYVSASQTCEACPAGSFCQNEPFCKTGTQAEPWRRQLRRRVPRTPARTQALSRGPRARASLALLD